jgi:tetratricopeptide (TPR) repeat protein
MEEYILPPGEKVKRIRGFLGLKQEDITGGLITRNLISHIENGKVSLVRGTAEIIVENILRWASFKKISLDINVEYLMRDETTQANILLTHSICNLETYFLSNSHEFKKELERCNGVLKEWDLNDKKMQIWEIGGEFYYKENKFNESYMYYLKALEASNKLKFQSKTADIYSKLAKCAIKLEHYQEAININNYAQLILSNAGIEAKNIQRRIFFNNALAYKKLGDYDACLKILLELENLMDEKEYNQRIDILMLKANCYTKLKSYDIAEQTYMKVVEMAFSFNDSEQRILAYLNLSDVYLKKKDREKAVEYLNKIINIQGHASSRYLIEIYLSLGKNYKQIGHGNRAEDFLLKAAQEAKRKNDIKIQGEIYFELLECYTNRNDSSLVDTVLHEIDSLVGEVIIRDRLKDIYIKASHYYIDKDNAKSRTILEHALMLINQKGDLL